MGLQRVSIDLHNAYLIILGRRGIEDARLLQITAFPRLPHKIMAELMIFSFFCDVQFHFDVGAFFLFEQRNISWVSFFFSY
jgi:hypothetical protein